MQLLNPSLIIDDFDVKVLSSNNDCSSQFFRKTSLEAPTKRVIWEQIRCGKRDSIPFWFFKKAPYMHPSGRSYAYLLYRHQKMQTDTPRWQWVKDSLSYFHLKELKEIQLDVGPLGGIYGLLANLDEKSLLDLINREGTILTKDFLLAKIKYPQSYNIMEYRFYLRDDLDRFLELTPYSISSVSRGKTCIYKDGPICWRYNTRHLFQMVSFSTVISFLGLMFIFILILWLLFSKIKQDKHEDKRRRMALQVLTHEFRTPVTSLLLTMENLNKRINSFDNKSQEDLLRMSAEIYRLQRLTEKSKHYLQGMNQKGLISFQFEKFDYLEDIIYDIITPIEENHESQVETEFIDIKGSYKLDLYWFQIIVKNLVENAFIHGKPPVKLKAYNEKNNLIIEVRDTGETTKTFNELSIEFSKGNKSSGTGLGLSIVDKVIKEWGGSIDLSQNPTTFKLKLPNKD